MLTTSAERTAAARQSIRVWSATVMVKPSRKQQPRVTVGEGVVRNGVTDRLISQRLLDHMQDLAGDGASHWRATTTSTEAELNECALKGKVAWAATHIDLQFRSSQT